MRRDRECVTVVSALANSVVFLDRVIHASGLRRSLLRRFFSLCAGFWELRPPVSLEVLVHGETLDLTSDLVGRRNLPTLPLPRGTWSTFTGGPFLADRIALHNERTECAQGPAHRLPFCLV